MNQVALMLCFSKSFRRRGVPMWPAHSPFELKRMLISFGGIGRDVLLVARIIYLDLCR